MVLIATFRIPGAAVGGFFSLLLSRAAPITTLCGGISTVACFFCGTAFVLTGAILLVDYPLTHFLWVILSFFVAFTASALSPTTAPGLPSQSSSSSPFQPGIKQALKPLALSPTFGFPAVWRLPSP
jgi:hypothetical protein